jgi:hypothetical protein
MIHLWRLAAKSDRGTGGRPIAILASTFRLCVPVCQYSSMIWRWMARHMRIRSWGEKWRRALRSASFWIMCMALIFVMVDRKLE